jgi:DNA-binding HxlR family transcriptional regulator
MDQVCDLHQFHAACPSRGVFDSVADKWSMMVLTVLEAGPMRFNAVRRHLQGVTQKALTECLRRLERNGLVERRHLGAAVEYEMTALGRTLLPPFKALYAWTVEHQEEVCAARARFDARRGAVI